MKSWYNTVKTLLEMINTLTDKFVSIDKQNSHWSVFSYQKQTTQKNLPTALQLVHACNKKNKNLLTDL